VCACWLQPQARFLFPGSFPGRVHHGDAELAKRELWTVP
jgi:hypothetical protein